MDQIRQFVDLVGQGNNIEAKELLDGMLSARAFEALESRKQELASTLFTSAEQSSNEE